MNYYRILTVLNNPTKDSQDVKTNTNTNTQGYLRHRIYINWQEIDTRSCVGHVRQLTALTTSWQPSKDLKILLKRRHVMMQPS